MSRLAIAAHYAAARWRASALHGRRLVEWQEQRAIALSTAVRAESPFYRGHWGDTPSSAWRAFPIVDKRMMMEHFDAFTTVGVRRDDAMRLALAAERDRSIPPTLDAFTVGLSSGTSGHRGLFLVGPDEQTRWAGTILARAIPDLRPGHRIAFFLRANSQLYERTSAVVQFRFFDLMLPIAAAVAALNAFRPRLIVGPPSLLGLLADARLSGALHAEPTRLISVAEVLEPQDRARLQDVFQAPVGEVYQCTEGLVAVSCAAGSLHVQEDGMVVQHEPIAADDALRVSPILTDLWRTTQPIVRYRLGDVLQLDPRPCGCGSTWQRIAAVEGRQDDLCWFPQADAQLRVVFPDVIRRMILLADARITEYHVAQPAAGELAISVNVTAHDLFLEVRRALIAQVGQTLREYGCHATTVTVSHGVAPIASGAKRRRIVRQWHAVDMPAAAARA